MLSALRDLASEWSMSRRQEVKRVQMSNRRSRSYNQLSTRLWHVCKRPGFVTVSAILRRQTGFASVLLFSRFPVDPEGNIRAFSCQPILSSGLLAHSARHHSDVHPSIRCLCTLYSDTADWNKQSRTLQMIHNAFDIRTLPMKWRCLYRNGSRTWLLLGDQN